jgi:hypothetical protein
VPDAPGSPSPASPPPPLSPAILKQAFTAFKKRWKVTKLDDESRLGGGRPTTTGRKSAIAGILPPNEFPSTVWQELARTGRIKNTGGGYYSMP